jgi:predicted nucleic acid-binding protein
VGKDMNNYLVDTNILIYYLADEIPAESLLKIEKILSNSFNISVITKIELLGWNKHTNDGFQAAENFIDHANIISLSDEIAELAIEIKRKSNIKLPDSVIASTCIVNNLILTTRNQKDFKNLPDLNIYNPFEFEI